MKQYLIIAAALLLLVACKENKPAKTATVAKDTAAAVTDPLAAGADTSTADADTASEEPTAIYYVVMADTGLNYYQLRDNMLRISKATGMQIDTMGRGYNKEKNLICLPENDEDEIYAGQYYPRRFPSVNLSLEYLDTYKPGQSGETTIALVAGICETQQSADSLLQVIRPLSRISFVEKSKLYIGCMH